MLVSAFNSSAYESDNSAQNELDAYMESLDAKIAQFQNRIQEVESDLLDSSLLKWFVDLGTTGVSALDDIINKFGLIPIAISTIFTAIQKSGGLMRLITLINNSSFLATVEFSSDVYELC
jgi:hypothetical protein